jgi:hypothetical protein
MAFADEGIYRLLSTESELPRPRLLCEGSLAECLDELKEVVLNDVVAANASALSIVAVYREDANGTKPIQVATIRTTGYGY